MQSANNTIDRKKKFCKLLLMRIRAVYSRKMGPIVGICAKVLSKDGKLPIKIIMNIVTRKMASAEREAWFSIQNFIVLQQQAQIQGEFRQIMTEKLEKIMKILAEYHYRPFLQKLGVHERSSIQKISLLSISKLIKSHTRLILLYSFHKLRQSQARSRLFVAPILIWNNIIDQKLSIAKQQAFQDIKHSQTNLQLSQLQTKIKRQVDMINEKTILKQRAIQDQKKKLQNLKGEIGNQTYLKNHRKVECRKTVQIERTRSLQLIRQRDQELKLLSLKQSQLKKAINVLETIDNDICSRKLGMKAQLQNFLTDISNSRRMYGIEQLLNKLKFSQNSQPEREHELLDRRYALLSATIKAYEQTEWLSPPQYKSLEQKNQAVKKVISVLLSGIIRSQIIQND